MPGEHFGRLPLFRLADNLRPPGECRVSGQATKPEPRNGVLRHEYLPADHYELESNGITELIETYYMSEMEQYAGKPWILRLRSTD